MQHLISNTTPKPYTYQPNPPLVPLHKSDITSNSGHLSPHPPTYTSPGTGMSYVVAPPVTTIAQSSSSISEDFPPEETYTDPTSAIRTFQLYDAPFTEARATLCEDSLNAVQFDLFREDWTTLLFLKHMLLHHLYSFKCHIDSLC